MKKFLEAYEEEQTRQQEQERLHAKHNIQDKDVVVVEKSNMFKFSIESIGTVIHTGAVVILLCLALTGLLCIIYPETRHPLWDAVTQVIEQLKQYVNR